MCLFECCTDTQLYTPAVCISHFLTNRRVNGFPQQCCAYAMFYSNARRVHLQSVWNLSLLLSLTQMLCPNQCSSVWRGSLSPAIILQVIPSPVCVGPSKWDKSEFQIQWILMQSLRPMLTYVYMCVCVCVCVCMFVNVSKLDQLRHWFISATIQTATGKNCSVSFHLTPPCLPSCFYSETLDTCKSKAATVIVGAILDLTTAMATIS